MTPPSPDGQWIALTAYTDIPHKDQASCEIYIMRVNAFGIRLITSNRYCDTQPRRGNQRLTTL